MRRVVWIIAVVMAVAASCGDDGGLTEPPAETVPTTEPVEEPPPSTDTSDPETIPDAEPLRLNVACSNVDGSESSWRIFGFAERGPLQWLRRSGDPDAAIAELQGHLEALIGALDPTTQQ